MQMGLCDEAVADYSLAISANPQCRELYGDRALAYQKLGKSTMADDDFRKARGGIADPLASGGNTSRGIVQTH